MTFQKAIPEGHYGNRIVSRKTYKGVGDHVLARIMDKFTQGNKKFKETRNWIFISIHFIFIIYILLLKVEFNGRFLKCNLDSMIKNIIINKSLFYLKLAVK